MEIGLSCLPALGVSLLFFTHQIQIRLGQFTEASIFVVLGNHFVALSIFSVSLSVFPFFFFLLLSLIVCFSIARSGGFLLLHSIRIPVLSIYLLF
jgi:hypothetical protein